MAIRYGLQPDHMPTKCVCSKPFDVEYALSCPTGGFPIIRHNEIRNLLANVMTETCHDVATEPQLQQVDRELPAGTNVQDGARLDISASGVWGGRFERTFFDVRVFNPLAASNATENLPSVYRKHETEKRRTYEARVRDIEGASFCPIVMAATGGQAPATKALVKQLASSLAEKMDLPYHKTINWLRNRMSFACIKACIMCLRGARSRHKTPPKGVGPICHRNFEFNAELTLF